MSRPWVIGHRGAAGLEPENTLKSFRRAIEIGVDFVECDVRISRDGRLVVFHDDVMDRKTDTAGAVAELDFQTIRAARIRGEPIMTLDELLETVAGRCRLRCELKAFGTAGPAVEAVAAAGLEADVVFSSFAVELIEEVKARGRRLRTAAIFSDPADRDLARAAETGAECIDVDFRNVSPHLIARAHEAGMRIVCWTPNAPADLAAMIALGVEGICTDRPDVLGELIRRPA